MTKWWKLQQIRSISGEICKYYNQLVISAKQGEKTGEICNFLTNPVPCLATRRPSNDPMMLGVAMGVEKIPYMTLLINMIPYMILKTFSFSR
jgi:hypothetical protein